MAKWSRKRRAYLRRKSEEVLAAEWRRCHAPDGKPKAVYPDQESALEVTGGHPDFDAYWCAEHQGYHIGHREHRYVRMRVRMVE